MARPLEAAEDSRASSHRGALAVETGSQVLVRLPEAIVRQLESARVATRVPITREPLYLDPSLWTTGAQVVATIITLVQGPLTVRDLTRWVKDWIARDEEIAAGAVTLHARGPNGVVHLTLSANTPPEDIASVIRLVITNGSDEPES